MLSIHKKLRGGNIDLWLLVLVVCILCWFLWSSVFKLRHMLQESDATSAQEASEVCGEGEARRARAIDDNPCSTLVDYLLDRFFHVPQINDNSAGRIVLL